MNTNTPTQLQQNQIQFRRLPVWKLKNSNGRGSRSAPIEEAVPCDRNCHSLPPQPRGILLPFLPFPASLGIRAPSPVPGHPGILPSQLRSSSHSLPAQAISAKITQNTSPLFSPPPPAGTQRPLERVRLCYFSRPHITSHRGSSRNICLD